MSDKQENRKKILLKKLRKHKSDGMNSIMVTV